MRRYEINWPDYDMIEEIDGKWVKYEEAQQRIEKLEKALTGIRNTLNKPNITKEDIEYCFIQSKQALEQ